jgi:chitin synthase
MFFFHIQALYNIFSLIFSWFSLANMWLTFSIIIDLLPNPQGDMKPIIIFGTRAVVSPCVGLWNWAQMLIGSPDTLD